MKYLILILGLYSISSCQEKKVELIYFTHYQIDTLNDSLPAYHVIEVNKKEEKYIVRVFFWEGGYYTGEHIQGDFKVSNDTIFLTYKYIEEKDKYKDGYLVHSPTVAYEYHFVTDAAYTFVYDSHIMDSIRFPARFKDNNFD